jgi:hypothetical protein
MKKNYVILFLLMFFLSINCKERVNSDNDNQVIQKKIDEYAIVTLESDISDLKENERQIIKLLIEASEIIDSIFWYENMGFLNPDIIHFPNEISKKLFDLNFGPWNRLDGNKPFLDNIESKPIGAFFYPPDITIEEFENFTDSFKLHPYNFIRRDSVGNLKIVPYHVELKDLVEKISEKLISASELTENMEFANYLKLRAEALTTDNYYVSDTTWLSMKNNTIDIVIGPVDIYEDKFYNIKAEHQAFVLIKDIEWSKRMEKYTLWLPFLQKALPVPEEYRSEEPGANSDINVYEVIFIAGSAKSGGATISQILPLEAKTQAEKGTRNLQFKNIIIAKFEAIVYPLSQIAFDKEQRTQINSDAFFSNVLFTEMAKSLGIKNTLNNKGLVRDALKDHYTVTEILKGYILTLFFAEKLYDVGEIQNDLSNNYITFVANILRVVRLGASSDYAKANLICFNYLVEVEAIKFNENNTITVDYEKMRTAVEELSRKIIVMEGDGNYTVALDFIKKYITISQDLQKLLDKIDKEDIPKDIAFEQGIKELGL